MKVATLFLATSMTFSSTFVMAKEFTDLFTVNHTEVIQTEISDSSSADSFMKMIYPDLSTWDYRIYNERFINIGDGHYVNDNYFMVTGSDCNLKENTKTKISVFNETTGSYVEYIQDLEKERCDVVHISENKSHVEFDSATNELNLYNVIYEGDVIPVISFQYNDGVLTFNP